MQNSHRQTVRPERQQTHSQQEDQDATQWEGSGHLGDEAHRRGAQPRARDRAQSGGVLKAPGEGT
eukprot:7714580-Alexandrium_andersonii.AAC.1